jgi:hypothetical protein
MKKKKSYETKIDRTKGKWMDPGTYLETLKLLNQKEQIQYAEN